MRKTWRDINRVEIKSNIWTEFKEFMAGVVVVATIVFCVWWFYFNFK